MSKAAEWLREERRKTLGDWVAICVGCGHGQRYFESEADLLPPGCPSCGEELRQRCGECGARIASMFAVECEGCTAQLRNPEVRGLAVRRQQGPGRLRNSA